MSENKLWDLIKEQRICYEIFEKFIYSDNYLKSSQNYDFSYDKSIYKENWNLYEFTPETLENKNKVFFQQYLDGEISKSKYLACENATIEFIMSFYNQDCYTFYDFYTDDLENNFPAQCSKDVLLNWGYLNENKDSFIEVKDKQIFQEISYLGIREIGLIYLVFVESKMIMIPNECRCTILTEQLLEQQYSNLNFRMIPIKN